MARIGSFLGPTEPFGAPLSVIKPPDNNTTASRYHPSLMDPALHLSDQQRQDMQAEIDDLLAVLKMARDLPPTA